MKPINLPESKSTQEGKPGCDARSQNDVRQFHGVEMRTIGLAIKTTGCGIVCILQGNQRSLHSAYGR